MRLLIIFLIGIVGFLFVLFFPDKAPVSDFGHPLIRVFNVKPNDFITSPIMIMGEARGYWFFEASFPIRLFDESGKELTVAVAQAQGEWMTENFVPFEATLEFPKPQTSEGKLVFQKDNPSGLPEHDDSFEIPVRL